MEDIFKKFIINEEVEEEQKPLNEAIGGGFEDDEDDADFHEDFDEMGDDDYEDDNDDASILEGLLGTIKEAMIEAEDIVRKYDHLYSRAKSYWIPHILMALDKEHEYMGGSMCTMQETIDDIREEPPVN